MAPCASVTGSAGSFTVTFAGTHANLGVPQIFGDATHATSGTVTRAIATAYDAVGQIASVSDPSATTSFVFDALGRATSI